MKPDAPLTAGARFIRGFTRIGTIAAILTVLIFGAFGYQDVKSEYEYNDKIFKNATCVARVARTGYIFKLQVTNEPDYKAAGCDDFGLYGKSVSQVIAIAEGPAPSINKDKTYGLLIITGVIAICFFVGFWAIGWLCAGFTRDA
jgi:hypothetical protein